MRTLCLLNEIEDKFCVIILTGGPEANFIQKKSK